MIKSISKCMQIMSIISNGRGKPVSLSKISELSGIPKPTCSHILSTLIEDGYAEQVSHTSGYVLGPSTYYLTRFGKYNQSFVTVCRPVTKWLCKQTGYPIVLAVIQGHRKYIIDQVNIDTTYMQQNIDADIFTDDIYRTSTGRMILSYMDEADIQKVYKRYGPPADCDQWEGVNSFESMVKALAAIRKQPYIKTEYRINSNGKITVGYAMPIFERYKCVGAVGIAAIFSKDELQAFEKNEPKLLAALNKAAKEIDRRLKFNI